MVKLGLRSANLKNKRWKIKKSTEGNRRVLRGWGWRLDLFGTFHFEYLSIHCACGKERKAFSADGSRFERHQALSCMCYCWLVNQLARVLSKYYRSSVSQNTFIRIWRFVPIKQRLAWILHHAEELAPLPSQFLSRSITVKISNSRKQNYIWILIFGSAEFTSFCRDFEDSWVAGKHRKTKILSPSKACSDNCYFLFLTFWT